MQTFVHEWLGRVSPLWSVHCGSGSSLNVPQYWQYGSAHSCVWPAMPRSLLCLLLACEKERRPGAVRARPRAAPPLRPAHVDGESGDVPAVRVRPRAGGQGDGNEEVLPGRAGAAGNLLKG